MWLLLVCYASLLGVHGSGFEPLVDGWLCALTQFMPAMVCWLALPHAVGRRVEVGWLAAAITAFASGNTVLVLAEAERIQLPVPSLADVGYLGFYPAALIAVFVAVRRGLNSGSRAVWLDSLIGGTAAAAVVAVGLGPAFTAPDGSTVSTLVSLAFPVLDLVVVFVVVAAASLQRFRLSAAWVALLAGFVVFACADVIYDRSIAHGTYHLGTPLDATWALGLGLMSLWSTQRQPTPMTRRLARPAVLAAPATALTVAIGVLVLGALVVLLGDVGAPGDRWSAECGVAAVMVVVVQEGCQG